MCNKMCMAVVIFARGFGLQHLQHPGTGSVFRQALRANEGADL